MKAMTSLPTGFIFRYTENTWHPCFLHAFNIVLTRTYRIRYFFGLPLSSNIANVEKMCTKTELLNMMGLQFA